MALAGQTVAPLTRPLRRAHASIWMVLPILLAALIVAALIVAALMARRSPTPANPGLRWESFR